MANLEKVKFKCWCCGKEFYTNSFNKLYCDECLAQHYVNASSLPIDYNFTEQAMMNVSKRFDESVSVQNILLVEDGSVDTDKLDRLGIKYIVYRQGSQKPEILRIWEKL